MQKQPTDLQQSPLLCAFHRLVTSAWALNMYEQAVLVSKTKQMWGVCVCVSSPQR